MDYIRAFISGIALPSTLLPFGLCFAASMGKTGLLTVLFVHMIPLLWGVWNVLYFAFFKEFFPKDLNIRLLITGAILGLLIALYGVFWLHLPTTLGFPSQAFYFPLIGLPILYAILWRFVVKPLNDLVGLRDNGF